MEAYLRPPVNTIFRVKKYLHYLLSSGNAHGLHSPFVYDLYTDVICDETPFYVYETIEAIRSSMLLSNEKIEVHDFGTGGRAGALKQLTLSYIARRYVKPEKYGQLLGRLVNHFRPSTILETGTSLGITTLYLSMLSQQTKTISLEGCPNTAAVARRNFQKAGFKNIQLIEGEFEESLPKALQRLTRLDFVYFDGNHQKEATLSYFQQCLLHHHENSVFVFDDIYWSPGMAEAWSEIKANERVSVTIDLYSIGFVFFKKGVPKQNFKLRF